MKWCVYAVLGLQLLRSVGTVGCGLFSMTVGGRVLDARDVFIHNALLVVLYLAIVWTWTH